jgi:hypothetical protein
MGTGSDCLVMKLFRNFLRQKFIQREQEKGNLINE